MKNRKILRDPLPYIHFKMTGLVRRFFLRRTMSSSKIHCYTDSSSVQFSRSVLFDSVTPWTTAHQVSQSIASSWSLPKLMSIELVMPSDHLILIPFSFCPQSFPASGSFLMSQLFTSGVQGIEVSASTSVLPMKTQDWSPSGWTGRSRRLECFSEVRSSWFPCCRVGPWSHPSNHLGWELWGCCGE